MNELRGGESKDEEWLEWRLARNIERGTLLLRLTAEKID